MYDNDDDDDDDAHKLFFCMSIVVRCMGVGLGYASISTPGSGSAGVGLGQLFDALGWTGSMNQPTKLLTRPNPTHCQVNVWTRYPTQPIPN